MQVYSTSQNKLNVIVASHSPPDERIVRGGRSGTTDAGLVPVVVLVVEVVRPVRGGRRVRVVRVVRVVLVVAEVERVFVVRRKVVVVGGRVAGDARSVQMKRFREDPRRRRTVQSGFLRHRLFAFLRERTMRSGQVRFWRMGGGVACRTRQRDRTRRKKRCILEWCSRR